MSQYFPQIMNTRFHLALMGGVLATVLGASAQSPDAPPFPSITLAKDVAGMEIVKALGTNLPRVAEWYGKTGMELRTMCAAQSSLRADRKGQLYYACQEAPVVSTTQATTAITANALPAQALTVTETFALHSNPGASRTIYLDFNGHTTSGTLWNNGATLVTPPYSVDATVTTAFSATELANILQIWKHVSEDYSAHNVNVTTADPGLEALRKTTTADTTYGVRVCIGGSSSDWFGAGAGGVAYLNSFSWNSDTPCFVFIAQLGNGVPKYVAEATSHEVGHTVSLQHDGRLDNPATVANEATEYYAGHANWAPIMGNSYYNAVTHFSKGEYAFANRTQDDLSAMLTHVPQKSDDHGDTIITATALNGTTLNATGIIGTRLDADLFGFNTAAGQITLNAQPSEVSPNLDIELALYDGSGNRLGTASPTDTLGTSLTLTVDAGTYYVAIDGTGTGDPTTAYNDYSSIGQYSLTGTVIGSGNQPPTAVASQSTPVSGRTPLTVQFSSVGSADSDGTIALYDWDFGDGSVGSAEANPVHTYTAVGTYTASLVVFDDGGLSSSTQVTITVVGNQLPTAVASQSTPISGRSPLTVQFSSVGSTDTDGTVVQYNWTFGDGTANSTEASPVHTYTAVGTYAATLVVGDNEGGLSSAARVTITVTPDNRIYVASIAMTTATNNRGTTARAVVTIRNVNGTVKSGATVTGRWSGVVTGNASGRTANNGTIGFTSARTRTPGTFTFTVTGVTATGNTYDPTLNTLSSNSITR